MAAHSPDDSSGDESFRTDILKAVGVSSFPKEAIKMQVLDKSWILPGEKILVEERNVGYISMVGKVTGKVTVTNYRLRFESKEHGPVKGSKECVFSVPLGAINRIEKVGHSTVSRGEDSYGLDISCKDMRNLRFTSKQANHSRRPLFEHLQKHSFPVSNKLPFFAFCYEEKFPMNGWDLFDPLAEFTRLGIPNDTWKLSNINDRYEYSDTYPALFVIPAAAMKEGDDFLRKVGSFRSKQRIPILSWIHPESQASITRSSQPMVGVTARKSVEDERYLQMIIEANAQSDRLFIFDARPDLNAKANKARGGGYESKDCYANCELVFLDIHSIHVMRESLRKLKEICFSRVDDMSWFSNLNETRWLEHIKMIMVGATQIVDKIVNRKNSVLVHCSDGWDRTAQLTSLALLMLDPFYRTLKGFGILIEKEWCSFGHKFGNRIGHGEDKHSDSERSPVFVQFIDSVWQVTSQFPTAFEFNIPFLIDLLDELYSCRFGTFLYNNEKQRLSDQRVKEKTVSLWSYVHANHQRYENPLYNAAQIDVLMPCCSMRTIKLWNDYYLRFNPAVSSHERMEQEQRLAERIIRVRDALKIQVDQLRVQAAQTGKVSM